MGRSRRFILFLAAAGLAVPLLLKGHPPSRHDGRVAFASWTTSRLIVRVAGDVRVPGIYTFPGGSSVCDVINLTAAFSPTHVSDQRSLAERLTSGDVVSVAGRGSQTPVISVKTMKAGERLLLGIPLDPNRMDSDDWDALPGIGPKLARDIVLYRQKYGEFGVVEALREVPGMGEKKFFAIERFFKGS